MDIANLRTASNLPTPTSLLYFLMEYSYILHHFKGA